MFKSQTKAANQLYGKEQTPRQFIRSLGYVKLATFKASMELNSSLPPETCLHIESIMGDVIKGVYDEYFTLPLEQGGAGTSLHINYMETIGSILKEKYSIDIDIFEALNIYQSTNDVIPSAFVIMILEGLEEIEQKVIKLQENLVLWEQKTSNHLIWGYTELQRALPIQLGQVFASWAGAIERDRWRISKLQERSRMIPLGGTALGTSFFAPQKYIFKAEQYLRQLTGLALSRSQNLPDSISNWDWLTEVVNGYSLIADNLYKISSDISLYMQSDINILQHPNITFGSSIMGIKQNPVILEFVRGLSLSISNGSKLIGEYSKLGQWQLNPFLPFMISTFIDIHDKTKKTLHSLNDNLLPQMEINTFEEDSYLFSKPEILNLLRPVCHYIDIKNIQKLYKRAEVKTKNDLVQFLQKHIPKADDFWEKYFSYNHITGPLRYDK
ncbi:lyase family protein [Spirochaeta cellobiosiphila]|uniref:lyase family protein n=1 Tax=Spirochaeta cellobiosiphila TaxID=504483 RepID=UPI0003F809EE|nr:lyase family protein [Spirochaeta cellobiosiphila]